LLKHGAHLFHQPNIRFCFERVVLFLRNLFKFLGHHQFLEISATPEKIMLLHDNGFVLLRFTCGFNYSSRVGSDRDILVD
jgi:hypothetical protein